MSSVMEMEKVFEMLKESAIRRFGEGRARILEPAIREIARSMVSVAQHGLELEEEPAFYG